MFGPTVIIWRDFQIVAPELAARAEELLTRFGFVFVGTVRPDGGPRVSAVEVHLVQGHPMLVMIAGTRKARDLDRDRRLTLQTPVTNAHEPGAEFKARGSAMKANAALRAATCDTIQRTHGWRPPQSWRVVEMEMEAAALLSWTPDGDMLRTRWALRNGLRSTQRRHLDWKASRYRWRSDRPSTDDGKA